MPSPTETNRVFCAGYGSLVHEDWARASVPSLKDFALYNLKGYRRVFGKVHPFCIYREEANFETLEVAACFIEPADESQLIVSSFSVPEEELPELKLRECDYAMANVHLKPLKAGKAVSAHVFVGYDADEQMPQSLDETYSHWPWMRQNYSGRIYRKDILPSRAYLKRCLQAYAMQGPVALDNFLDHSYLADRQTAIRTHLKRLNWDLSQFDDFELPHMPENKRG